MKTGSVTAMEQTEKQASSKKINVESLSQNEYGIWLKRKAVLLHELSARKITIVLTQQDDRTGIMHRLPNETLKTKEAQHLVLLTFF